MLHSEGGEFNFDATCGLRPLENNRRRRSASSEEPEMFAADDTDDDFVLDTSPYRKLGRIHGGEVAVYGMYPWQVGIRKRTGGLFGYHFPRCGGTIIGEYWVLSAAHCFR